MSDSKKIVEGIVSLSDGAVQDLVSKYVPYDVRLRCAFSPLLAEEIGMMLCESVMDGLASLGRSDTKAVCRSMRRLVSEFRSKINRAMCGTYGDFMKKARIEFDFISRDMVIHRYVFRQCLLDIGKSDLGVDCLNVLSECYVLKSVLLYVMRLEMEGDEEINELLRPHLKKLRIEYIDTRSEQCSVDLCRELDRLFKIFGLPKSFSNANLDLSYKIFAKRIQQYRFF